MHHDANRDSLASLASIAAIASVASVASIASLAAVAAVAALASVAALAPPDSFLRRSIIHLTVLSKEGSDSRTHPARSRRTVFFTPREDRYSRRDCSTFPSSRIPG